MKLETTARQLRSALRLVGHVIERRNTYPVLACVLIDGATLKGTNLDQEIAVRLAATAATGKTTVDYRRLQRLVDLIDGDATVTITAGKEWAKIAYPGGAADLPVTDPDGWPSLLGAKATEAGIIPLVDSGFGTAVKFVAPSISTEETRYYLNGICISKDFEDQPCLVATNGHQMSVAPFAAGVEALQGKILPRDAIKALLAMPEADSVTLFDVEKVRFNWPSVTLTTKLIEGTFPDWKRVTPKLDDSSAGITLDKSRLLMAMKRAEALSAQSGPCATLTFSASAAVLTGTDGDALIHETLGEVATTNAGAARMISFNTKKMRSLLTRMGAENLRLAFSSDGAPIKLSVAGQKSWAVLMPMRGADKAFALKSLREASPVTIGRAA
jgi:DNA polymerase-3 subunit beta